MNDEKDIMITGCIIGGLVGICGFLLGKWMYQDNKSDASQPSQEEEADDYVGIDEAEPNEYKADMQVTKRPPAVITAKKKEIHAKPTPILKEDIDNQRKAVVPAAKEIKKRPEKPKQEKPAEKKPFQITDDSFPLKLGSRGKKVERLQVWLMRNFGHIGKITDTIDHRIIKLMQKHMKGAEEISEAVFMQYRMDQPVHQQGLYRQEG